MGPDTIKVEKESITSLCDAEYKNVSFRIMLVLQTNKDHYKRTNDLTEDQKNLKTRKSSCNVYRIVTLK